MVKKNQVIITALAIMIAVAGYLNFTGSQLKEENLTENTGSTAVEQVTDSADASDISDEDTYTAEYKEIQSLDSDSDVADASDSTTADTTVANSENQDTPGEAILTGSTSVGVGVVANAKLMKEQTRAKNKETLLDVINNESVKDTQKQEAINEMISMTDITERETAAEILLAAKGFSDSIVSITGNSADVVINASTLTDAQRAQIEDIVKRKTGVTADNLVITPLTQQDN